MSCTSCRGLGRAPYYRQSVPTPSIPDDRVPLDSIELAASAFVKAIQARLGQAPTGNWDAPTHAAVYTWNATLRSLHPDLMSEFPRAFGEDPERAAAMVGSMSWFAPEALPYTLDLMHDLGLEGDEAAISAQVEANRAVIEQIQAKVRERVFAAETPSELTPPVEVEPPVAVAMSSGLPKWAYWVGGALIATTIIALIVAASRKRDEEGQP